MKKTDGAEPGWYDDPETEGRERYWNGNYWETSTRQAGEEVETPLATSEFHLGPMFFRKPLGRDNAFKVYAVIAGLSLISGVYQEINSGTRIELIFFMTLGLIPIMGLYIYILFLPYLWFRRRRDKKRGITSDVRAETVPTRNRNIAIVGLVVALVVSFFAIGTNSNSRDAQIESFITNQKEIGAVLNKYNSAAGGAVGVVRGISDGTLSAGEGISQFAVASTKITPVLTELREECEQVTFPKVEGEGEDLAIAKGMNMLRVVCDVTPKQFLVLQQIFQEQISENGTQARLDQLSGELEALNQEKINAAIDGIKAILPYANKTQADLLNSMLDGFVNR